MRDKQLQLDQLNTSDHAEFWRKIKELGSRRSDGPPIDVYNDEGHIIADINCVLDTWAKTYRKLYEPYQDTDNVFDKELFETKLLELDLSVCDPASDNPILNETMWLNEIQNSISHAKNEKTMGLDNLPYKLSKNNKSCEVLAVLFRKVFDTDVAPSVCCVLLSSLYPKGLLQILDCHYNIEVLACCPLWVNCFGMINARIIIYLEANKLIVEEQNGPKRSMRNISLLFHH